MSDAKESRRFSNEATPADDRKLAHPHREDQAMTIAPAAAVSDLESSAFGLTAIEGAAETGAIFDAAFDSAEGRGVGMVKTTHPAVILRKQPALEPEVVDLGVLDRSGAGAAESDEDGFGFIMNEARDRFDAPADGGEEGPKGGAVFETH